MNTSMGNGMQMMFEQCELPTYPLQTAGPSVHRAKISASLEEEQDLKASEAPSRICGNRARTRASKKLQIKRAKDES